MVFWKQMHCLHWQQYHPNRRVKEPVARARVKGVGESVRGRVLTVALKTGECTQVDNSWGDKTHTFGGGGTYQSPLHHTHAKLPTHSGKTDIHMQHRATAAPVIEGMHVEHAET